MSGLFLFQLIPIFSEKGFIDLSERDSTQSRKLLSLSRDSPKISGPAGVVPRPAFSDFRKMFAMNRFQSSLVCLITLVSCSQLFAHPGHGSEQVANPNGILHYLTEPVHLIPFAAVALFVALFVGGKKLVQRHNERRQKVTVSRNDS